MNAKQIVQRVALVLAGIACMAPGCEGDDVLKDPTFRLWCGEVLCDWKLDSGSVKRVATWHPNDYGVEFTDTPTEISQESTEGSDCMEFTAVANVDAGSQMKILVDFNLDGTPEFESRIAATNYREAKILIRGPENFTNTIRFTIRKDGQGQAVLAEIRLRRVTTCDGPRAELKDLHLGARCGVGAQCQTGDCCGGVCSQCCPGTDRRCKDGVACTQPNDELNAGPLSLSSFNRLPPMCGPGERRGRQGDECVAPGDCASNGCDGAMVHPYAYGSLACPDAGAGMLCFDSVIAGRCR